MPESPAAGTRAIVVTTINPPSASIRRIAALPAWRLTVVGDRKTPDGWSCEGATYLSLDDQLALGGAFAAACPVDHYARKNVGYLLAMGAGAAVIAETDDDNDPYPSFPGAASQQVVGHRIKAEGWQNVYRHFTPDHIWPRGFPLEHVLSDGGRPSPLGGSASHDCPVQQFLADGDADVDAVFRLTVGRKVIFEPNVVVLGPGTYCPFNSQNTVWWPDAYPLLYLPGFASFRMTDIWRSLVAQVCVYAMSKSVAFGEATVFQDRNDHSLLTDFRQEVPGYVNNARIIELLAALDLSPDPVDAGENLRRCYAELVAVDLLPPDELVLVDLWLEALASTGDAVR